MHKQPFIQWLPIAFWPAVKQLGHGVNHLPPSAEVSNEWSYTSAPYTCLHGMHRNNYTFTIRPDEGCYCLGCDAVYGVEQNNNRTVRVFEPFGPDVCRPFLTGALCSLNRCASHGSPIPLIKFQVASRPRLLTSSGNKQKEPSVAEASHAHNVSWGFLLSPTHPT